MTKRKYTRNEERANAITHGAGIFFGAVASVWLLLLAMRTHNLWAVSSVLVYVVCMILSYTASTIYHACSEPKRKIFLQKLDHAVIYFHIAGTYTFFTLTVLRTVGAWGWSLFTIVWISAVIGVLISFRSNKKGSKIETICYVVMGMVVFIAFKPLINTLDSLNTVWYILAGGASFITGAVLYSFKKIKYMHSVFHVFVLGGSFFHILAIASVLK